MKKLLTLPLVSLFLASSTLSVMSCDANPITFYIKDYSGLFLALWIFKKWIWIWP